MHRLDCSRLTNRLLAGRMPFVAEHVDQLRAEGVEVVINLCQEREYWEGERGEVTAAYRRVGIAELHLPVTDGSTIPSRVLERAIEAAGGRTVYVHCRGGRERSATVATALIAASEGVSIDGALDRAVRGRPIFAPLPWQLTALRAWAAGMQTA